MEAYLIAEDVYRIPGGFGRSGENFGGILLKTNPPILIGASGGKQFISNLQECLQELQMEQNLIVYLPNVLWQEVITSELIVNTFPFAKIHVHKDVAERIKHPKEKFFAERHDEMFKEDIRHYERRLPKDIENVVPIDKSSSFQADKTKILVIPNPGPHKGHTFIYSRDHRLLATGVVLGLTPSSKRTYYLDFTGNIKDYMTALDFLDQARSDIIFSAYDEPFFTNQNKPSIIEIRNALEKDKEGILEILTNQKQKFSEIVRKFKNLYTESISTEPYKDIDPITTLVRFHLNELIKLGKVVNDNDSYRTA